MKLKSLNSVLFFATAWTAAYQALPSIGFSRQEYWSGVPLPSPQKPWKKDQGLQKVKDEEGESEEDIVSDWLG